MRGAGLLPFRLRRAPRPAPAFLPAPAAEAPAPAGERPYGRRPGHGPDTGAFRRIGPAWHPAPAPVTAPQPVIADGSPGGTLGVSEVLTLRRIRDGIKGIDWDALDAARAGDGLTYARTTGAPLHNALLTRWQSPVRPVRRHGTATARRAEALAYPPYSVAEAASYGAYAKVMEHADRITGTHGTGLFRPALPAGDSR